MERSRSLKSAKSASKNGGSKRGSKSKEPSEQKSKTSSKRKAIEKEASDSEDDAQLSEEAQRPPVKPVKTVKKPRMSSKSDEDDTDSEDTEDTRTKLQMNSEGDMYMDLGKKKRVTVRSFKGMTLVDIREYYGTDGDEKPGKKGISLTVEQWENLMQASTAISDLL